MPFKEPTKPPLAVKTPVEGLKLSLVDVTLKVVTCPVLTALKVG